MKHMWMPGYTKRDSRIVTVMSTVVCKSGNFDGGFTLVFLPIIVS